MYNEFEIFCVLIYIYSCQIFYLPFVYICVYHLLFEELNLFHSQNVHSSKAFKTKFIVP